MAMPLFIAPDITPVAASPKPRKVECAESLSACSGDAGKDISMRTNIVPSSPMHSSVAAQLEGAHFLRPFVIQTCGHTPSVAKHGSRKDVCAAGGALCREVTALIVVGTLRNPVRAVEREAIAPVAVRAGVPLFSMQYDPTDHISPVIATRNGESIARDIRGFRLSVSSAQAEHFSEAHPDCYRPEGRSDRSRVGEWSEPFERTLRKIPTSRAVTVDGGLVCDGCGDLIGIVDVRPLAEHHRRNRVSYLMPLANPLGIPVVLVEHHDHPSDTRPTRALTYRGSDIEPVSSVEGSIHDIAGALYDVIDEHRCNVGGH